ncbi:MAG: HEAT repeat domain-containing protein [bacterium]|nr:HEAT repeat domain-containing protein [bacterium]
MKKFIFIILFCLCPLSARAATNTSITNRIIDEKTIQFWNRTFQYGISSQKDSVCNYIRQNRTRKALDLLVKYLPQEKNASTRKLMIMTLVSFTNREVVPSLLDILKNEKDQQMRILALSSLGELKYRPAYQQVMEFLDSEDEFLVENALRALGQMEAKECTQDLLVRLETEKRERIRTALILALANIKSEKAQEKLISIVTNDDEREIDRSYAVTGLGFIRNKRSYDVLVRSYARMDPNIKVRIIDSLGNLEYREAIGLLKEALKDDDKNIRYYSVMALGRLKARECLDILEYKKDYDPDYKVREKVKEVLKELK